MNRLKTIDTTNQTINAQLFSSETILESQVGIGIYDGKNKDDRYQDGTLYLTSHRLIYVDRANPHHHSCFLDISLIRQTEYWIGFLKSSPKITLLLGTRGSSFSQDSQSIDDQLKFTSTEANQNDILNHPAASHWTCHVCGFSNSPELKCALCGIPRELSSTSKSISNSRPPLSSSRSSPSSQHIPHHTKSLSNLIGASNRAEEPTGSLSNPANREMEPIQQVTKKEISCSSCTFLNHPSMARCEMCDSILGTLQLDSLSLRAPSESSLTQSDLQHSHATTPAPPSSFPADSYIRLSFRKGGEKTFYFSLKKALQTKSWNTNGLRTGLEFTSPHGPTSDQENPHIIYPSQYDPPTGSRPTGIDRILKTMDSQQQAHQTELTEGLQDLQALMAKAKEMVQLSQSINAKLTSLEASGSKTSEDGESPDQKAGLIRSSLVKLGLPTPAVTADMISSDQAFAQELAKELAGLLTRTMSIGHSSIISHGSHQNQVGIRPLDEIWCIWNRARGISLVSPADMISACQHLPDYTNPEIRLRTFKSGLRVLHTPQFSEHEFENRLLEMLRNPIVEEQDDDGQQGVDDQDLSNMLIKLKKLSTLEIAQSEGLSMNLTNELIESIEQSTTTSHHQQLLINPSSSSSNDNRDNHSKLVRDFDPQTGLTYWFENHISNFSWVDLNP
ncbi:hypothetical protein Pst134EA_015604 [Puccinia striiformis f. sp. tritici]|uniref:hypothetical protein n=1 Tax=Puccinia striiformis f. sp. tritici TaxID=168172 RepID=UPI0020083A8A|nr:hypothetical protein Pst134EA_015604 [Puccinia striiformis f. sp. tritici]KAH9463514.1 hypothetical protein Pst134EA_015604 [Puccinia striiformis f. sp. tritici]